MVVIVVVQLEATGEGVGSAAPGMIGSAVDEVGRELIRLAVLASELDDAEILPLLLPASATAVVALGPVSGTKPSGARAPGNHELDPTRWL